MTAAANSPVTESPFRQAPAWRRNGYLAFTLCAALYLIPFMRVLLPRTNEGTLVYGADRIVQGQVFARDFFEVMGPGTFYWLAAFFKLFGVTFFATRICLFVTSLGTGLLIYFLSRRICGKYQSLPCIVLAGTYYGMQWPAISHHVDSNFFALLSVACVVLWQDKHWNSLLVAAGVLAGLTTCILQPKGIFLLFAILLWLGIQRARRAASIFALGSVAGGYLAVIGVALAYFWSHGALGSLIYANILWPLHHYEKVNTVPYALGLFDQYWTHWAIPAAFHWSVGLAAILITPFIFVAAIPIVLPVLSIEHRWRALAPEAVLYFLCGCALWLSEVHRKDIYHLVFGSPLLLILCICLMVQSKKKMADYALQILLITAVSLATFNFVIMLTPHVLATRVGQVAMFKDDPVLASVDANVSKGTEMFVYPYCPMYYFLSATVNPTRYSVLVYNYNTPSEFNEVIQLLERRRVPYVLWDTTFQTKIAPLVFPGVDRMPLNNLLIEPYLESHYKLVSENNGVRLMERKSETDANRAIALGF